MSTLFKCMAISLVLLACALTLGCNSLSPGRFRKDRIVQDSSPLMIPESVTVSPNHAPAYAGSRSVQPATTAAAQSMAIQPVRSVSPNASTAIQPVRFEADASSVATEALPATSWATVAPPIGLPQDDPVEPSVTEEATPEASASMAAPELPPGVVIGENAAPPDQTNLVTTHRPLRHGHGVKVAEPFAGNLAVLSGNYLIETGDNLDIKFRQTPELNEQVTVRPDGMISLQLVGDVAAAGLTPEQLRASINAAFASQLKQPDATVIVRSFSGNSIYVGGEVFAPGRLNLTGRVTTLNAIILAGGFKDTADQRRVIVRRANGSCCEYDMKSVIECEGGQNIQLQPYDVVYVPKSKIAKVNLFVEQYIDKVLPFSRSFGIFISHNTGLTSAVGSP